MGKLPSELGTMNRVDWIPVNLVAKILVELLFAAREYRDFDERALSAERYCDKTSDELPSMDDASDVTPQKLSPLTLTADPAPNRPRTPTSPLQSPSTTFSALTPRSKTFNIVNPQITSYPSLIPFIQSSLATPLQITPLAEWLQVLRHASDTPAAVSNLPALKVISFIESFLRPEEAPKGTLSTGEAVKYSQTMKDLTPVGENWVGVWMKQWGFGGSLKQ
ncbi:MAG: hypothetical protein Q9209_002500 [Squamulea sp. 1 TL-2023]